MQKPKLKNIDLKQAIDKDKLIAHSLNCMIAARQLLKLSRETALKKLQDICGNSKDLIKLMVEKVNESAEDIDRAVLSRKLEKFVIPYVDQVETKTRSDEENARRLDVIKKAHERRQSKIAVGLSVPSNPAGYISRGQSLIFSGPREVLTYLCDFVFYMAISSYSLITSEPQRVFRFAWMPYLHKFTHVTARKDKCLFPAEYKKKDPLKLISPSVNELGQLDLVLIDDICLFKKPAETLAKLQATAKEQAFALMVCCHSTNKLDSIRQLRDSILPAKIVFCDGVPNIDYSVGRLPALQVPEKFLEKYRDSRKPNTLGRSNKRNAVASS